MSDDNHYIPLSHLEQGSHGEVRELKTTGSMRRRLQEIGLIEGTHVDCIGHAPSGDPTAYYIRGAVIALRSQDAAGILINRT